jgi:hypothetical protein
MNARLHGEHQAASDGTPGGLQTLPCGCKWRPGDPDAHGPVFWNRYNRVVQCHKCGQVYTPEEKS